MRNPNGYGSVTKLGGARRNPFIVRKTKGYDLSGKQLYYIIGYAPTREKGLIMLADYNKNPYDVDLTKMTLEKVFELWKKDVENKINSKSVKALTHSTYKTYVYTFKHVKNLAHIPYINITKNQMQDTINSCEKSYSVKNLIQALWASLDAFAYDNDIVCKKRSENLSGARTEQSAKHKPFEKNEIDKIWQNQAYPNIDTVLFMLYTSFRLSAMRTIKTVDVDICNWTVKGGVKTANSIGRTIPIHDKLKPLISKRYNPNNEYLFSLDGKPIHSSQSYYDKFWRKFAKDFGFSHTPHDCRHTIRTALDNISNANQKLFDLIMGHASSNIGDRVYNHKTIEQLRELLERLPY